MSNRYGLEIRSAGPADAAGLSDLLGACGLAIAPRALAERIEALRQDRGSALLALAWGPPSGLIVLHWHATLVDAHPVAAVSTLAVAPEERRQGIGRLLLKAGAQAARAAGCGVLHLDAGPEAASLRGFCAATGFAETAARYERPLRKRN
ncbi:GNAT family N-acetyltransferase [Methylobacterium radiodurans]|uniref:GNAT family N-acetyltransferase n=1 Tax=Methylobacterium radiodurans TaxID=2202828 RepID=A0A2U8VLR6_9HYPH|nr:GNAT family N-acetyltransferase [Methylobacterium radiodurans]AWN34564.1 GNAT family N-acetyltransferase [Methylobacterium radiodurans]